VNESKTLGIRLLLSDWDTLDLAALMIGLIASFVYFVLKWDMLKTILISVVCGIVYYAIFKGLG
jgi:chromate transporter